MTKQQDGGKELTEYQKLKTENEKLKVSVSCNEKRNTMRATKIVILQQENESLRKLKQRAELELRKLLPRILTENEEGQKSLLKFVLFNDQNIYDKKTKHLLKDCTK